VELMPIGAAELAILAGTALATAMLSAIVGMAGGITLLAVMLLFLPPLVVIPLHGAVQLVSNSSRTLIQRKHLRWDVIWRYGVLLLPMGFAGLALAQRIPPDAAKALIGAFVLFATWAPGLMLLGTHPQDANPRRRFFVLGGVVGVVNMTVGATGPLIAPFFLNMGLTRFQLIGTKAACQALGHMAKILVFGIAGFAFGEWSVVLAILAACVVAGTWLGSQLLEYVNETWFVRLYKTVLTVIALRLVITAVL
jgi:uncharacterized membrane protein YfcA